MNIEDAPKESSGNWTEAESSDVCGCYFCITLINPLSIEVWADCGKTALCPKCGVDAVLPGVDSIHFLARANEMWFTGNGVKQ